jgi:hypothetical protein
MPVASACNKCQCNSEIDKDFWDHWERKAYEMLEENPEMEGYESLRFPLFYLFH